MSRKAKSYRGIPVRTIPGVMLEDIIKAKASTLEEQRLAKGELGRRRGVRSHEMRGEGRHVSKLRKWRTKGM